MTAHEIFQLHIESWGDKEKHLVTEEEFQTLLSSNQVSEVRLNEPNEDGSFFSSLMFLGVEFCIPTSKPIKKTNEVK